MTEQMLSEWMQKICIVLIEPTHPGNIGGVARAMKNMGLSQLRIVKPKKFPHIEAEKRAAGAQDVLQNAHIYSDIQSALSDVSLALGTSTRDRDVVWPTCSPKQAFSQVLTQWDNLDSPEQAQLVAIVFGRESSGLTNAELAQCRWQVVIPASLDYSSLNLASAVQILCYEARVAISEFLSVAKPSSVQKKTARQQLATHQILEGMFLHLSETLQYLDFAKSNNTMQVMHKLIRLYRKAQLTEEEVQILRGIYSAIQAKPK